MERRDVGGQDSARFFRVEEGETESSVVLVTEVGRDLEAFEEVLDVGEPNLRNRLIIEVGFDPDFVVLVSASSAGMATERGLGILLDTEQSVERLGVSDF